MENIKKYVLDNGLTVIIENIPHFKSTSLGYFLKRGSRDESKNQGGYSHFCEHMIFKGTNKHTKNEIAQIFDEMGGYFNAYTNHELVVIYNRVPDFYLKPSLELMYEMFNDSVFDENETNLERDVILNEINSTLEDPADKVHEDYMSNLFPEQGLGLPVIGTEESIKSVSRDDLFDFYNKNFVSDDLLLVICGNVNNAEIIDYLSGLKFRRNIPQKNIKAIQTEKSSFFTELSSEQLHIVLGTSKFNLSDITFLQSNILNLIIGESMSSKLFQKLREDLGLCYSVYSFFNKYREENIFGIYMSIMPKNVKKTIDAIDSIIKDLLKNGISQKELEQAKKQKIGEIILSSDILQKRMNRIASIEIKYNKIYDEDYFIDKIKQTNINDLNNIINEVFINKNFLIQGLYKKKVEIGKCNF